MSSNESSKRKPSKSETLESMKPTSVAIIKNSNLLIGSKDGFLRFHSLENLSKETVLKTSLSSIDCLLVDSSDKVWAGGDSGDLQKYSLAEKPEVCLKGHNETIVSIHLDSTEKFLYSTSEDMTIRRWDLNTNESEILHQTTEPIICADFNNVLDTFAICTTGEELIVFNVFDLENTQKVTVETKVWSLKIVDSKDWLIEGNADGNLVVRNLKNLLVVKVMNGHESRIKCISLTVDQKFVVTGSFDQMVFVWDLKDFSLKYSFEGPNDWVRSVVANPEFTKVYSVSDDSQIYMWKIPIDVIPRHETNTGNIFGYIQSLFMFIYGFLAQILLTLTNYYRLDWDIKGQIQSLYRSLNHYTHDLSLKQIISNIFSWLQAEQTSLFYLFSNLLSNCCQKCCNFAKQLIIFVIRLISSIFLILISIPANIYVISKQLVQPFLYFN